MSKERASALTQDELAELSRTIRRFRAVVDHLETCSTADKPSEVVDALAQVSWHCTVVRDWLLDLISIVRIRCANKRSKRTHTQPTETQ